MLRDIKLARTTHADYLDTGSGTPPCSSEPRRGADGPSRPRVRSGGPVRRRSVEVAGPPLASRLVRCRVGQAPASAGHRAATGGSRTATATAPATPAIPGPLTGDGRRACRAASTGVDRSTGSAAARGGGGWAYRAGLGDGPVGVQHPGAVPDAPAPGAGSAVATIRCATSARSARTVLPDQRRGGATNGAA
jgi:hypothetical protein